MKVKTLPDGVDNGLLFGHGEGGGEGASVSNAEDDGVHPQGQHHRPHSPSSYCSFLGHISMYAPNIQNYP